MSLTTCEPPAVSVVIPVRNEARHIEACLRNVLAFESPTGAFEVIIADGRSDDDTRGIIERIAQRDPRVRLVDNPERTTPCGLNAAIKAAKANVILRIDAHTVYAPDYLRRCLEVQAVTGADNVGGPWVAQGETYLQKAIAAAFRCPLTSGGARSHDVSHEGPVDSVYLGCWPREVFDRIGLFDQEFVRNQDDELNYRMLQTGHRIWQSPRIRSWYTPRNSLGALFRQYFQYGYWKIRVMQKHGKPASPRHLVPCVFVSMVLTLAATAPLQHLSRILLLGAMGVYGLALATAAAMTAAESEWSLLPILPLVVACYHVSYGLGSLFGVWDFLIRRRSRGRFVALTRG
ncbi:MAG TPA: glycosyltransferase family 2 protein [Armatimonadota bacterium]